MYSWGSGGLSSITRDPNVTGGPARLGHGRLSPAYVIDDKFPCCPIPKRIETAPIASEIACGQWHSFFLEAATGHVFSFGGNSYGQCGIWPNEPVYIPSRIDALMPYQIKRPGGLIGGRLHSGIITQDGHLVTWGYGAHGQLGTGDTDYKVSPEVVKTLDNFYVEEAAFGKFQTIVVAHYRPGHMSEMQNIKPLFEGIPTENVQFLNIDRKRAEDPCL